MTRTVCGRCEMDKCQCKTIGATAMNELQIGDIVQIDPSMDGFGGCLAVVNEVKDSGRVMAYVQNAGQQGQAYIYLNKGKYEPTGGRAVWVVP